MEYFNKNTEKQLTLVATFRAKTDKIEKLKKALLALVDTTRAEEGSISYHLYSDRENPQNFIFHEIWASEKRWQQHMENNHLKDFFANEAPDLLDGQPVMQRWERSVAPVPVIDKDALVLFAYNTAQPGKRDAWEKILTNLIPSTLAEKGALHYELHRNKENRDSFMFHETWQTVEDWNEHMKTPHLKALLEIIADYTENGISVTKTKAIS